MKSTMVRRVLTVGAALMLAATAAATANAVVHDPRAGAGSLFSSGPLMDNGFPTPYKDSNGGRLEACISAADPLCPAAASAHYNPTLPVSFPTNFPDEFFYQLDQAILPVNPANAA